jgi:septal ring factor EnvC (AmiA/AmiB activator)
MEVVRQAMLLRTSLPIIQDRAEELREGVQHLSETRDDINRQLDALKGAADLYTDQHSLLDALIEKQAALLQQTETERRRTASRLKRLTREAETLKELFARLEAERPAPPPAAPEPQLQNNERDKEQADVPPTPEKQVAALTAPRPSALRPFPNRGSITLPVRGDLSRHYGENTPYGNTAKGLTFETRPAGRVVAPYDGKVVFSGPFRGYGQILIIEHSGGYHTLLSGLERVDASVGQWLLAGEPVGIMPKPESGNPRLYFELRREGQPINPLPWFAEYRGRDRS